MHTPGPWRINFDPEDERPLEITTRDPDHRLAFLASNGNPDDARLLAASPRLLGAVRLVLHGIVSRTLPNPVTIDISQDGANFPLRPLSDILREIIDQATVP